MSVLRNGIRMQETDIDYLIADWDDIQVYKGADLYKKNLDAFKTALLQFVGRYVDDDCAIACRNIIEKNL